MNKFIAVFFLLVSLLIFPKLAHASEEVLEGTVIQIIEESTIHQKLILRVDRGSIKGESIQVDNGNEYVSANIFFKENDKLVLASFEDEVGNPDYIITDYVRRDELLALFILFVFLVILIGRFWGLASLVGMAISFFIIFSFILPMILKGYDAVLISIIGSIIIIPATFGISHGFNRKTFYAMLGTIITLVITGLLSIFFVEATHLTGYASEEAGFLSSALGTVVNVKGILLAGMIIATLGILDDITISQASIVNELKSANSKLTNAKLFAKAMNVGRDHISSLVNTLVLVYTGASLPLLLLFLESERSFLEVINYELIADEIVRTLVGSIGLVLAVPITTAIAVYFGNKNA